MNLKERAGWVADWTPAYGDSDEFGRRIRDAADVATAALRLCEAAKQVALDLDSGGYALNPKTEDDLRAAPAAFEPVSAVVELERVRAALDTLVRRSEWASVYGTPFFEARNEAAAVLTKR